jgi:hypothetical protein
MYLQVDGGAENANKYVLGFCELIVCKRMARDLYFTRLPVGHTHEDIDACFAVIWRTFRTNPCLSMQQYRKDIEDQFKSTRLSVTWKDVYIVPDYRSMILP